VKKKTNSKLAMSSSRASWWSWSLTYKKKKKTKETEKGLGLVLLDFGNYIAICIIEYFWIKFSICSYKSGKNIGAPNTLAITASQEKGEDQIKLWVTSRLAAYKQLSHTDWVWWCQHHSKAVIPAAGGDERGQGAHHTLDQYSTITRTPQFFHSTTNTLEHHPTKPWSRTWSSTSIPGGEGQATSSSPRRRRTSNHSGGEGQASEAEPGGEGQARSKPQLISSSNSLQQDFICKSLATGV
jgi:hypothetical protein